MFAELTPEKNIKFTQNLPVVFGLLSNLACSLTIVFLNKWLYSYEKFPNLTLTFLHFCTTSIGIYLCYLFGFFKRKTINLLSITPLALCFCGFVVFTNLSLENNTVGTYQLCKTLTTPFIMLIQTKFYDKYFTNKIKLTMLPIIIGVLINSYYDLSFNYLGAIFASLGILVTSMYQILVGAKQKELNISSQQLLLYQAPLSSVFLFFAVLYFEPPLQTLANYQFTQEKLLLLSASCFTSFFVNITIYYVIGNTSAVTYNMFGHFKFVCTMVGGFLIFRDPISSRQFLGIILTCLGIGFYTKFKLEPGGNSERKPLLPKYASGGKLQKM